MPQLGIVTFHSSFNEGAILQALALSKHLSGLLPDWQVEIVDLYYGAKQAIYERTMTDRERAIREFSRAHLPLSKEKSIVGHDHRDAVARLGERYQALVYGSDEVWKLRYKRSLLGFGRLQQDDPFFPAFPNAYWPEPSLAIPQFAYAVCAGETRRHLIPEEHRELMRRSVASLSLIGVRDTETRRLVEWLEPACSARIQSVPDPTFSTMLVEHSHVESARRKLESWGVDFARPTAVVLCKQSQQMQPLLQRLRHRGYQTAGFVFQNSFVDLDLSTKPLTPVEWMAAFGLFDVCVSERMHACISCLLQDTPVIALDFLKDRDHPGSKIEDLFDTFGLAAFYHPAHFESAESLVRIWDRLEAGDWPTAHVQRVRETLRARSIGFAGQMSGVLSPVQPLPI